MPEFNGSIKLLNIVVSQTDGKRIQKEHGIGLPGMALGQRNIPVAQRLRLSVNSPKVRPFHPSYKPHPDFRVNHPVKIQRIL